MQFATTKQWHGFISKLKSCGKAMHAELLDSGGVTMTVDGVRFRAPADWPLKQRAVLAQGADDRLTILRSVGPASPGGGTELDSVPPALRAEAARITSEQSGEALARSLGFSPDPLSDRERADQAARAAHAEQVKRTLAGNASGADLAAKIFGGDQ